MINISALEFVIVALAVFRITRFVTTDTVFNRLREWVWKKHPPENGGIGYLLTCNWCSSIWVALPVVLVYSANQNVTFSVACVFALSAITGIIAEKS